MGEEEEEEEMIDLSRRYKTNCNNNKNEKKIKM
jgi:hypothetical protein